MTGSTPDDGRPPEPTDGETLPPDATPPGVSPTPDVSPPDAPTQRTGIISATPVGWAGSEQPAPPADQPVVTWAPPAAAVAAAPSSVGEGLVIAGTFTRVVAYVIDALLVFLVVFLVGVVVGAYRTDASQAITFVVGLVSLALSAAYFIGLWRSAWHGTLGMRLMRIRVLGAVNGATLGLDSAVIRWLALTGIISAAALIPVGTTLIGLLALIWVIALLVTTVMDPLHQGLHDRWAGSVVVQPAPGGSGLAVVGCLVLVGLVVIVPFILALLLSDSVIQILSRVGQSI